MKKKNYAENSEEDNEFDVDEPEEIQNNASDDDWTPDKDVSVVNIKQRSPYLVHLIYTFMVKKGSFMIPTYSKTPNIWPWIVQGQIVAYWFFLLQSLFCT